MKRWIRSGIGHKTTTPIQFAESLVSYAPVANVLVMSGGIRGATKLKEKRQIKNISFYHDFEFESTGVRVRKASGKISTIVEIKSLLEMVLSNNIHE